MVFYSEALEEIEGARTVGFKFSEIEMNAGLSFTFVSISCVGFLCASSKWRCLHELKKFSDYFVVTKYGFGTCEARFRKFLITN